MERNHLEATLSLGEGGPPIFTVPRRRRRREKKKKI